MESSESSRNLPHNAWGEEEAQEKEEDEEGGLTHNNLYHIQRQGPYNKYPYTKRTDTVHEGGGYGFK